MKKLESHHVQSLMPRVAAKLDTVPISDIIGIQSEDTFVRTVYAGNAVQTVQSNDSIKLVTVRGTAFPVSEATGGSAKEEACKPLLEQRYVTSWSTALNNCDPAVCVLVIHTEHGQVVASLMPKLSSVDRAAHEAIENW